MRSFNAGRPNHSPLRSDSVLCVGGSCVGADPTCTRQLLLVVSRGGIITDSAGPNRIQLLVLISLLEALFELLLPLHLDFLLVFEDGECTELIEVLSRQSILAEADQETLVSIQDATLL